MKELILCLFDFTKINKPKKKDYLNDRKCFHLKWIAIFGLISFTMILSNLSNASSAVERTGDILQLLIPTIAYGTTVYLNDRQGIDQFNRSFFATLSITQTLKNVIHKKRPNGHNQSFPSGHTSSAFQGAAFIHKRYGLKYALPAYIGATFVGYSRIDSNHHYLSDVLAGAAIGILSNMYFTKNINGFMIQPSAGLGFFTLAVSKRF